MQGTPGPPQRLGHPHEHRSAKRSLRYNFTNAMVSKISLSEGGATTSGVQIEEATLACETLVKALGAT